MSRIEQIALVLMAIGFFGCGESLPEEAAPVDIYRYDNTRPILPDNSLQRPDGEMGDSRPVEDTNSCPCSPGETRCSGQRIQSCRALSTDQICGVWSEEEDCSSPQAVCLDGECGVPDGCLDRDGDGYGPGCAAGQDCDDADPARFAGNIEICDAKDNDCDGAVDEGLDCSTSESICSGDLNEPNDSLLTAAPLSRAQPVFGAICAGEHDYFEAAVVPGEAYRLHLMYPEATSDLDLRLFEDGQMVHTSSTAASDQEVIAFVPNASMSYHVEVVGSAGVDNVYRLSLLGSVACHREDAYAPNQSVSDAAPLLEGQRLVAHMCDGTEDWYYLGILPFGERIVIQMSDRTPGDGDLDIEIYADENGDGQATLVDLSYGLQTDETLSLSVTASPQGPYLLKIMGLSADSYEILWTRR
jgi:hypothetical protein